MTALGWVFLLSSMAFVWGLTGYCFYRVLTAPQGTAEESEPAFEKPWPTGQSLRGD